MRKPAPMNAQQEIAALRDKLEVAEHTIRELKGENIVLHIEQQLKLPRQRAQILAILFKRERVGKEVLLQVLYSGKCGDVNPKILDVLICYLRKEIRQYKIQVKTIWGFGWYLDSINKNKLQKLLAL